MAQQLSLPGIGALNFDELKAKYEKWLASQHPAVEVLLTAAQSSAQGAFIGFLLGSISNMDPSAADPNNPQMKQFQALNAGGPWVQARNLAVMTGVNSGLSLAIKKARKGKEDVWGAMAASFGAGACFALVSGLPNPGQSAFSTGCAFALFNGLFYQIGKAFQPKEDDGTYDQGKSLLRHLGLTKFEKNLQKSELDDHTIMLWTENALQEAKIPAGPRLRILHHLDQFPGRRTSYLKPALPVPVYPGQQQWPTPQALQPARPAPPASQQAS